MWIQFFLENIHFALNIFGALSMFAVAWLYMDAWISRRQTKELLRTIGFILLGVAFILHAANVESGLSDSALLSAEFHSLVLIPTKLFGYILIIVSLLMDPLQPIPKTQTIEQQLKRKSSALIPMTLVQIPTLFLYSLASLGVGIFYFRRASTGLERHLYGVAMSFFAIAISDTLSIRQLLNNTDNVDLYKLVSPFGPVWVIEHLALAIGLFFISRWVFFYLIKRFETQLFMIFTTTILSIFLITTVTFTGLLVKNIVDENLRQLTTDAQVLALSIDSKKSEAISDAQVLAQNPFLIEALRRGERRTVADITRSVLLSKQQSTLLVVDTSFQVVANGEDIERYGYSVSGNPLLQAAITGKSLGSMVVTEGIIAPIVSVQAATPIKDGTTIIGAVLSGTTIDTALLDGIKKATGLDASLYGDTVLSATTLVAPDGFTRPIGITEENEKIINVVMGTTMPYAGSSTLLNKPYFGAYLPLSDHNDIPVGMLFVGKPQRTVFSTAGRSIELTFIVTILLLLVSIIPAYAVSRFITKQIK